MNSLIIIFSLAYLTTSILNLAGNWKGKGKIHSYTKPLLMPLLLVIYLLSSDPISLFVVLAIFASFLGDILLMVQKRKFFVLGLFSFLLGHLFYIVEFLTQLNWLQSSSRYNLLMLIPYMAAAITFFYIMLPYLKNMKLPIILYMFFLLIMSYLAFLRYQVVSPRSFIFVFCGSLYFVISDSLIAIRTFRHKYRYSNFIIMLTYLAAQALIIWGLI